MTRKRYSWVSWVRYDCDGIAGDGWCNHKYPLDGWGYSAELCEWDKPWKLLKRHGWTRYNMDGWTHHRCGPCNAELPGQAKET